MMSSAISWPVEIARLYKVKEAIAALDADGIYKFSAPRLAASDIDIQRLKTSIPVQWDKSYLGFLRFANGWPHFLQNTYLFGTEDFAGDLYRQIAESLRFRLPMNSERFKFVWTEQNCLPIGGSLLDNSIFVIERKHQGARVAWLNTDEVDGYIGFEDFFIAMIEYNKQVQSGLNEEH